MKFQQATEKQRLFIKKYVSSGDELESARVAGYSDRSLPSLRAEASRLKRRLASHLILNYHDCKNNFHVFIQ